MENMYITRTRLRMQTNVYQRQSHRKMIKTEEKAKVVTVGWGMYSNAALNIIYSSSKDDLINSF